MPKQRGLLAEIVNFYGAARDALASEWAFQTARALQAAKLAGWVAGLGCLVLSLLFFVVMALVMGALLGLSAWLGPWVALVIVVAVLGLAAYAALRWMLRKAAAFMALFGADDDAANDADEPGAEA